MAVSGKQALAAAGVAAALIGGLTAAVTGSAASAGASPLRGPSVTYSVFKQGETRGPGALHPGMIKFHVVGKGGLFQLVRSRHGAGMRALVADINAENQGNPNPAERDFGLVAGVKPGHDMWTHLIKGTYYAFDPGHRVGYRKIRKIIVAGSEVSTVDPASKSLWAVGRNHWAMRPHVIPHAGVLNFQNHADQSHFLVLNRMKPGKTYRDVGKALRGQEAFPQVFYTAPSDEYDTGVISPGRAMSISYSLPRGKYAVLCFYPDRMTRMPHAFMGMFRVITLR